MKLKVDIQLSIQQAMLKKNILEENKSTRSVDDVFYILKTVLVRGGQTAPDCLCVLINQIGKLTRMIFNLNGY